MSMAADTNAAPRSPPQQASKTKSPPMPAAPHSTRPLRHATNRSWQHTRRRPASLLIDSSLRPLSGHRIDAPPWDPKPRFSLPAREGTCPTVVHARAASSASISAAAFIATSCMLAAIRVRLGTCRHFRWVASLVPPCRTVVRRHWLARHHAHEAESGAARVGAGAPYR